ncbi:MAG: AAA family ATPase [Patescibacteria group bacterium]
MKKLKKFLKHRKPVVVFIYGAPAVGKYTTAKKLARITGFKLLHSHAIRDLVFGFFNSNRENIHGQEIWKSFYLNFTEGIMKEKVNIIFTHTHARNRIYCSGLSGLKFVDNIVKVVKRNEGIFYPVHLVCEDEELFKRIVSPSRKNFGKACTVKELKWMLRNRDYKTSLLMKNNFIINNTRISAKRTAKIIKDHFNL